MPTFYYLTARIDTAEGCAVAEWDPRVTSFANPAVTIARSIFGTFAGIDPSGAPVFILVPLIAALAATALATRLWLAGGLRKDVGCR